MGSTYQHAYQCEVDSCELDLAVITSEELALIRTNVPEEAPDSNCKAGSFEPKEDVKEVPLDPPGSGDKKLRLDTALTPK